MTEFSRNQILAEVERMCEHGALSSGSRPYELLLYLIDETLAENEDRLKAYTIALDVFDRSADFDPSTNSLVRVEMHRLRRALTEYADFPPKDALVCLSIEKSSYKVEFSPLQNTRKESKNFKINRKFAMTIAFMGLLFLGGTAAFFYKPTGSNCTHARPGVFVNYTDNSEYIKQVADHLNTVLQEYPLVSVIKESPEECTNAPTYVLNLDKGNVEGRVVVEIHKTGSKSVEWRGKFTPELNVSFNDAAFIAASIAYSIGSADGAIPKAAMNDKWHSEDEELEFKCLMSGHRVFILHGSSPATTQSAFECLSEFAYSSDHADNAALLAALHFYVRNSRGESRRFFNRAELDRAIERAEALDPTNKELLHIKLRMLRQIPIHTPSGREDRKFDAQYIAEAMRTVYPHEPHILGQLAVLEAWMLDNPEAALKHNATARSIAPQNEGLVWGQAYASLATGDWQFLNETEDIFSNDDTWYWVLVRMKVTGDSLTQDDTDMMSRALKIQGINNVKDVERTSMALGFGQGIQSHLKELATEFL